MIFFSYSVKIKVKKNQTMEFCKDFCSTKLALNDRKDLNLFDQLEYDCLTVEYH